MPILDSAKQEEFAQEYVRNDGNGADAYRHAYNAEKMKNESIWTKASELLAGGKVAVRVKELKERLAKRCEVTLDGLNAELVEANAMAKDNEDYSEVRQNVMARGKLNGLIIDKTKELGDKVIKLIYDDKRFEDL